MIEHEHGSRRRQQILELRVSQRFGFEGNALVIGAAGASSSIRRGMRSISAPRSVASAISPVAARLPASLRRQRAARRSACPAMPPGPHCGHRAARGRSAPEPEQLGCPARDSLLRGPRGGRPCRLIRRKRVRRTARLRSRSRLCFLACGTWTPVCPGMADPPAGGGASPGRGVTSTYPRRCVQVAPAGVSSTTTSSLPSSSRIRSESAHSRRCRSLLTDAQQQVDERRRVCRGCLRVGLQIESQHRLPVRPESRAGSIRLRGLARSLRAVDGPRQVEQPGQRFGALKSSSIAWWNRRRASSASAGGRLRLDPISSSHGRRRRDWVRRRSQAGQAPLRGQQSLIGVGHRDAVMALHDHQAERPGPVRVRRSPSA